MRKFNLFATTAIAILLVAALVVSQTNTASAAPEVQRVGLVVAYTEGQSITIVDRNGGQFTFELASPLKIVPPHRADMLAVGAYVTIIAPNNIPNGKHIAQGIVIHPQPPAGFPIPTNTLTPVPTETALPTETLTETPLPAETETETPLPTETENEPPLPTETETETPLPTEAMTEESPTPTPTNGEDLTTQADPERLIAAFFEWLISLLRSIPVGG